MVTNPPPPIVPGDSGARGEAATPDRAGGRPVAPDASRWPWAWIAVSVGVGFVLSWSMNPVEFAFRNSPDDAFFYPLIGRNIVAGLGSTTDGLGLTNGYQPLWMLVQAFLCLVFSDVIRPTILIQYLLSLGTLLLLARYVASYTSPRLGILAALVASFEQSYFHLLYGGMESGLAAFFLLLALVLLREYSPDRPRRLLALSVAMTLLFFSRLDGGGLYLAVPFAFLLTGTFRGAGRLRQALKASAPLLALPIAATLGYLLWNAARYSIPMPVSGAIKAYHAADLEQLNLPVYLHGALTRFYSLLSLDSVSRPIRFLLGNAGGWWPAVVEPLGMLLLLALSFTRRVRREGLDLSLASLLIFTGMHGIYYTFLQRDYYSVAVGWVKAPELVVIALGGGLALQPVARVLGPKLSPRAPELVLIALLVLGVVYNGIRIQRTDVVQDLSVARADFESALLFIRERVPPEEVIASENIGFLGYLSGRKVLSIDGLANSTSYYRDFLRPRRQFDYLARHSVRYFAAAVDKTRDPVTLLLAKYPSLSRDMIEEVTLFNHGAGNPRVGRSMVVIRLRPANS